MRTFRRAVIPALVRDPERKKQNGLIFYVFVWILPQRDGTPPRRWPLKPGMTTGANP